MLSVDFFLCISKSTCSRKCNPILKKKKEKPNRCTINPSAFVLLGNPIFQALDWCPWKPYILATGSSDGCLKLWNVNSGVVMREVSFQQSVRLDTSRSFSVKNKFRSQYISFNPSHLLSSGRFHSTIGKIGYISCCQC